MPWETTRYSRDKLYEEVWAEPMRQVAQRYGVSDVALAKTCRRLGVPLPGRGYWAKKAAGHNPERPPLPALKAGESSEYTSKRWTGPSRDASVDRAGPVSLLSISVPSDLRRAHPLVLATKDRLAAAKPDFNGCLSPCGAGGLDVRVGRANVQRALRILDSVVKYLDGAGHKVSVSSHHATMVSIDGQSVQFGLREGLVRTKHNPTSEEREYQSRHPYSTLAPEWELRPSGQLFLVIKDYLATGNRTKWGDAKKHRLEDQLGAFVVGLERAAEVLREHREALRRAEEERLAAWKRQEELRRRRQEEEARVKELLDQVARWQQSDALRRFVAAARATALREHGSITPGSEFDLWMQWVLACADRMDPLQPAVAESEQFA